MAIIITVGSNSWVTLAEADQYMEERMGAAQFWAGLTDDEKMAALISAYRQLIYNEDYSFPTAIASITDGMQFGQCEQALFIAIFKLDLDRRQGLQAQGVIKADIVMEWYDKDARGELPVSANAKIFLKPSESIDTDGVYAITLERDPEEDVSND